MYFFLNRDLLLIEQDVFLYMLCTTLCIRATIFFPYYSRAAIRPIPQSANIESSPVWDTSCLTELIYNLFNKQLLCGKYPKPVTVQYFPAEHRNSNFSTHWVGTKVGRCPATSFTEKQAVRRWDCPSSERRMSSGYTSSSGNNIGFTNYKKKKVDFIANTFPRLAM